MLKILVILAVLGSVPLVSASEAPVVFVKKCKSCHGKDGTATKAGLRRGSPPNLFEASRDKSKEDLERIIKDGVFSPEGKKKMPPYKNKLNEGEIQEIIQYILKRANL